MRRSVELVLLALFLWASRCSTTSAQVPDETTTNQVDETTARAEREVVVRSDSARRADLMVTLGDLLSVLPVRLRGERTRKALLVSTLRDRKWQRLELPIFVLHDEDVVELYVVDGSRDRVSRRVFQLGGHGFDDVILEQVGQATLGQIEAILQGQEIGATVEETLSLLESDIPQGPTPPEASSTAIEARVAYHALAPGTGTLTHEGELSVGLRFGTSPAIRLDLLGAYGQNTSSHTGLQLQVDVFRLGGRVAGLLEVARPFWLLVMGGAGVELESASGSSTEPQVLARADSALAAYADVALGLALAIDPLRVELVVGARFAPRRDYVELSAGEPVGVSERVSVNPFAGLALSIVSPF